ncbi:MAG: hypothetical protein ACKO23_04920, partial [Gemmataceae bacterium]
PEPRNLRQRMETLLNTALIGSQHRLQINESRYQLLIALISLERATGGGFCANLETASPVAEWTPASNEKPKEKSKEDNTSGKDKDDPKKPKKNSDNSNDADEEGESSKKPTKSDKKEDPKKDK